MTVLDFICWAATAEELCKIGAHRESATEFLLLLSKSVAANLPKASGEGLSVPYQRTGLSANFSNRATAWSRAAEADSEVILPLLRAAIQKSGEPCDGTCVTLNELFSSDHPIHLLPRETRVIIDNLIGAVSGSTAFALKACVEAWLRKGEEFERFERRRARVEVLRPAMPQDAILRLATFEFVLQVWKQRPTPSWNIVSAYFELRLAQDSLADELIVPVLPARKDRITWMDHIRQAAGYLGMGATRLRDADPWFFRRAEDYSRALAEIRGMTHGALVRRMGMVRSELLLGSIAQHNFEMLCTLFGRLAQVKSSIGISEDDVVRISMVLLSAPWFARRRIARSVLSGMQFEAQVASSIDKTPMRTFGALKASEFEEAWRRAEIDSHFAGDEHRAFEQEGRSFFVQMGQFTAEADGKQWAAIELGAADQMFCEHWDTIDKSQAPVGDAGLATLSTEDSIDYQSTIARLLKKSETSA